MQLMEFNPNFTYVLVALKVNKLFLHWGAVLGFHSLATLYSHPKQPRK
jgi:hypothetical protein